LEEVFKPYYRIHDDVDGSGLGLYISRSIARSHGGDVTLSNSPDGVLEVDIVLAKIV
jgi:signal transduction histidine kinase